MWRPWRVRRRLTGAAAPIADGGAGAGEGTRQQHAAGVGVGEQVVRQQDAAGKDVESYSKGRDNRHNRQEQKLTRRKSRSLGIRKRDTVWLGLAAFFLSPVFLVLVGVVKDRRISGELQWNKYYMRAVVENDDYWRLGWRLEDLARQASAQRARMSALLEALHEVPPQRHGGGGGGGVFSISHAAKAAAAAWAGGDGDQAEGEEEGEERLSRAVLLSKVLAEEEDMNRIVSMECASRPGVYVQVGMHAMVASADAGCKVFSAATTLDPHALFEKIELGEGRFALRAFSNRRFLRVTPPVEGEWTVWILEAGAPEVGLPEVFQMRDGMVYSEVMHGYLSCSGDGAEAEVKGFVGEFLWQSESNYEFVFKQVSHEAVERARSLRDVSRAVNKEQRRAADAYIATQAALKTSKADAPDGKKVETIAVCVPMTSRGTVMNTTFDSPVWTHAFSTFLSSTSWRHPKFRFRWYFGFDVGDHIYDGAVAAKHLKKEFFASAVEEFGRQRLSKEEAQRLIQDQVLILKTKSYRGMQHAPSFVVSALMQDAYDDGCDYLYQINDDTNINTPGWAEIFTRMLRTNPLGRNVGVTGPADTNNRRILTHAFVHRTHIDVFGRFFPPSFRNWWSDDWISNVYGREHTLRDHSVTITHDVKSLKSDQPNRYTIDYSAQNVLRGELRKGHVRLSKWLKANDMPPPLLPMVCGYAPLASDILKALQGGWGGEKPPAANPPPAVEDEDEPAAASLGSSSKTAAADAARHRDGIDDAHSPVR